MSFSDEDYAYDFAELNEEGRVGRDFLVGQRLKQPL